MIFNKVSRMFKGIKDKFNSFIKAKEDVAIRKDTSETVSESVKNSRKKRKVKFSRWSRLSWILQIRSITSSKLSEQESIYLAKNWFGNFRGVRKFRFKRNSKTPKTPKVRRFEGGIA